MAGIAAMRNSPMMMDADDAVNAQRDLVEKFARRHFEALQQAGLTSWTFSEFFAFCAPLAQHAVAAPSAGIEAPTCVTAAKLADAIGHAYETHCGKALNPRVRNRIIRETGHCLAARNRRQLRLTHRPPH